MKTWIRNVNPALAHQNLSETAFLRKESVFCLSSVKYIFKEANIACPFQSSQSVDTIGTDAPIANSVPMA